MKGVDVFYCSFFIEKFTIPTSLDEFDGYLEATVKVVQCENQELEKVKTLCFKGTLPSPMRYWIYSGKCFYLKNKSTLCVQKDTKLHDIQMEYREPFVYMEDLYFELLHQPEKRGGVSVQKKLISKLLQYASDNGWSLNNKPCTWKQVEQLPVWISLFGAKCDAVRTPMKMELNRFYCVNNKKKVTRNEKLYKVLEKMTCKDMLELLDVLRQRPWMLGLYKFVKKFDLQEMSAQGVENAIAYYQIDMSQRMVIVYALQVYGVLKTIREQSHSTCISLSYLESQCKHVQQPWFQRACQFLNFKATVFLQEQKCIGLLEDYEYAKTIFQCLEKLVLEPKPACTMRGFEVPCIPCYPNGVFEPEQQAAAKHVLKHKLTVIEGLPGTGKCLGENVEILLANGTTKLAKHIEIGDRLVGDDGTLRIVTSICSGQSDMFRVYNSDKRLDMELDGGFECNDVHNLVFETSYVATLPRRTGSAQQCTMEARKVFEMFMTNEQRELYELSGKNLNSLPLDKRTVVVGHKWKSFRRSVDSFPDSVNIQEILDMCVVNSETFPSKGTCLISAAEMSYYVGVWLGDGKSTTPYSITIAPNIYPEEETALCKIARATGLSIIRYMSARDSPNGEKVKEFVILDDKKRQRAPVGCFQYTLTTAKQLDERNNVQRNVISVFFDTIGLSTEKHIPNVFFAASRYERLCLLAGLLDTDGYLSSDMYYEITQKNRNLSLDIVRLSRSLGFRTTINSKQINGKIYYRMNISGKQISDIPCQIRSKIVPSIFSRQKSGNRYGTMIEYIGKGNYYGFQLAMLDEKGKLIHSSATCGAHTDGRYPGRFLLGDYTVTHNTELIVWIKSAYENVLVCSFVSMMVQSLRKRLGPVPDDENSADTRPGREEAAYTLHYVITMAKKAKGDVTKWLSAYDVIVIDEGSNVSLKLMAQFLQCIPNMKKLVLLGDMGQIGPIQPGFVFQDLVQFAQHYKCWFRTVTNKRTDPVSAAMADNAAKIANDQAPDVHFLTSVQGRPAVMLSKPRLTLEWDQLEGTKSVQRATRIIKSIYEEIIKDEEARSNLLLHQIVLLRNRGPDGRNVLNRACENALIELRVLHPPHGGGVRVRTKSDGKSLFLFKGKKIVFVKKYKAMVINGKTISDMVLNGEQGIVTKVSIQQRNQKRMIRVWFTQTGNSNDMDHSKTVLIHHTQGVHPMHIDDGYAITTNKAQGSEWPYVVYWMEDNPGDHWTREYSYVALSRAKNACWVVGEHLDFLRMCHKKAPKRFTILSTMLASWTFDPLLLKDKQAEETQLKPFHLLTFMDFTKKCSPTPTDPKKKYPANR